MFGGLISVFFRSLLLLSVIGAIGVALLYRLYMKWTLRMCPSSNLMTGKTVVITGANSGIGKQSALELAKRDARVIMACRNLKKAHQVRDEIVEKSGNERVEVRHLDLASFKSVRKFAAEILESETRLDVLINNAGCFPAEKLTTEDGMEYQMQSNYLGHFLLTNLLLGLLKSSAPSRIINVSSIAHSFARNFDVTDLNKTEFPYSTSRMYTRTKLCQLLFSHHLAPLIIKDGVTINSLCPGPVETEIFHDVGGMMRLLSDIFVPLSFKVTPFASGRKRALAGNHEKLSVDITSYDYTPIEGAQTVIYLAVADEVSHVAGQYFSNCKIAKQSTLAVDDNTAKQLWDVSETLVGLKQEEKQF